MTNKISTRKLILLSLIAVLLIIYICQLVISGRNDGYTLSCKSDIDTLIIQNGNSKPITLTQNSGTWLLTGGSEEESDLNQIIPASPELVTKMTDFIKDIYVLALVANSDDSQLYGFEPSNTIVVTAQKAQKVIRTIYIGKNSVTSEQVYAKLDDKKEIVLISGNPRNIFNKTFSDLKAPIQEQPSPSAEAEIK